MYYKLNVCSLLITKCDPLRRKEALVAKVERVRMAEMNIFAGLQKLTTWVEHFRQAPLFAGAGHKCSNHVQ
jgi:hypothetical protein